MIYFQCYFLRKTKRGKRIAIDDAKNSETKQKVLPKNFVWLYLHCSTKMGWLNCKKSIIDLLLIVQKHTLIEEIKIKRFYLLEL